jgi:hypothetical protein
MSVPPPLARAVQYYYQERQLPPWEQEELLEDGARQERRTPSQVARYYFELFVPLAERQRGGAALANQILEETTPLFAPPTFPFSDQNFSYLTLREQLYYTQCDDEPEMLDLLARYRQEGEVVLREIYESRKRHKFWRQYTQPILLSGHSIYHYSTEQLLNPLAEGKQRYAFDRGDLVHLLQGRHNPYTKTPLPLEYLRYLEREKVDWRQPLTLYPLEEVLQGLLGQRPWCPLRTVATYYVTKEPLAPNALFPKTASTVPYQQISWFHYYVYQKEEETGRAQLVLDPYRKPPPYVPEQRLEDPAIQQAIHNFHAPSHPDFRQIPRVLWPRLQALYLKSKSPLRVYRGLYRFKKKLRQGESFPLTSEKVQSWTPNLCVAEDYSIIRGGLGVVVSTILQPEDILIDSRYIANEQLAETVDRSQGKPGANKLILFMPAQNEILSKPGTYQVIVERLTYSHLTGILPYQFDAMRDDVHDTDYLS